MNNKRTVFRYPCSIRELDSLTRTRAARDLAVNAIRTLAFAPLVGTRKTRASVLADPDFLKKLEFAADELFWAECADLDMSRFRESFVYEPGWKRTQAAWRLSGQAIVATVLGLPWELRDTSASEDDPTYDFCYRIPAHTSAAEGVWRELMTLRAGHYATLLMEPGQTTAGGEAASKRAEELLGGFDLVELDSINHHCRNELVWLLHRVKPALQFIARRLLSEGPFGVEDVTAALEELVDQQRRGDIAVRDWKLRRELRSLLSTEEARP